MTAPPLLDLHHLGHRQTGNETWARCLSAALFELDGPDSYDIAVTSRAPADDLARLPARERATLSGSSTRRLALDLPAAMRRLGTPAVLVQYTAPVSRVPAVVAVHDLSFEDPRAADWLPRATRLRYRATIRASVRRAAHVIVDSEYTRIDLMDTYSVSADKVTVVPLAVDPRFSQLLATTPENRSGRPTVLMVGNVLPRKNLPVVARAVRLMRDRGQEVTLRVIGTVAPSGRADAALAQRLLGDAVTMTGYVTQGQLAQELRTAHVLAFPSLFEGFGIPALEAMAAGLPAVVSNRTSLPEVVGGAATVVAAEDEEAWAAALERAMVSIEMVAAGRQRVADMNWRVAAGLVSELLAGRQW